MTQSAIVKERNELICRLYREGTRQVDLANRFHRSASRIGQILRKAKITTVRRTLIKKRSSFVGAHIDTAVKRALALTAENEGYSISEFISNLIVADLKHRGVKIEVISSEVDVPLPLEG